MPKTDNIAEGVFKQLEMGFKTMEPFESSQAAAWSIDLLLSHVTQKRRSECRDGIRRLSSESRLQADGFEWTSYHWFGNSVIARKIGTVKRTLTISET